MPIDSGSLLDKINRLDRIRPALPAAATAAFEWHDEKDLSDETGQAGFNLFEVQLPFYVAKPVEGMNLALALDYNLLDLDLETGNHAWDGQLHALYLPLTWGYRPSGSEWMWLGQVAAGLRSDFESINGDAFAFRTFAAAMRQINEDWTFAVGAYFSHSPEGIFAAPGIGFTWMPAPDWTIGLIPPRLTIAWQPSDEWIFTAQARPRSFDAALNEGPDGADFAEVSYIRLGVSAKRRLLAEPGLWAALNIGYSVGGSVNLERGGQALVSSDLDGGFWAGGSLELLSW
jgi:hypothetical protein